MISNIVMHTIIFFIKYSYNHCDVIYYKVDSTRNYKLYKLIMYTIYILYKCIRLLISITITLL